MLPATGVEAAVSNGTMDASLKSMGLDMTTLFHLYLVVSFLSLVVHLLQLILTFTNMFFRLITFCVSLVFGLFTLQLSIVVFIASLPIKIIVGLNRFLGTPLLVLLMLSLAAFLYFSHDPLSQGFQYPTPTGEPSRHFRDSGGYRRKEL